LENFIFWDELTAAWTKRAVLIFCFYPTDYRFSVPANSECIRAAVGQTHDA
jgi:hypothetical protein